MSTSRRRPAARSTTRRAQPARAELTPEQWRLAYGVCLAGGGLLVLIVPGLRAWAAHALGVGWPVAAVAGVAGGCYLAWPDAPPPRRLQALAAAALALSLTALLGWISAPLGGMLGHLILSLAAPVGGPLLLLAVVAVSVVGAFGLDWRRATIALAGLARAHAPSWGRVLLKRQRDLVARARSGPRSRVVRVAEPTGTAPPAPRSGAVETAPAEQVPVRIPEAVVEEPPGGAEPAVALPAEQLSLATAAAEWDTPPEGAWTLPPLTLLDSGSARKDRMQEEVKRNVRVIEGTLATFGVQAKVVDVNSGPAVTQYALQPAAGVPVRKVVALQNDLSLALALSPLRLEVPIPGKSAVGIEVPNKAATLVTIRAVVESPGFQGRRHLLGVALGADVTGQPISADLTQMPHLLIAGATGQGKSVCINTLICSLLLQATPAQLRMVMIDPKRVELQGYNGLPHLAVPVIVEPPQAAAALRWGVAEMERRYKLLAREGVRNVAAFNERAEARRARPLPYVVIVIDELADLMMVAAGEIEELVCRLAQLARAVGIHLVIATQRPSTDIITGLIKANIPSRIAFAVGSQVDSRVILDAVGAEKLLGRGDMLYQPVNAGKPARLQGAFISDREVEGLVQFWREQGEPEPLWDLADVAQPDGLAGPADRELDELFGRAARVVAAEGAASVALVQRRFNVGYSRAGRIVDMLAGHRVIGPYQGSKAREVLMSLPEVDELLERLGAGEGGGRGGEGGVPLG